MSTILQRLARWARDLTPSDIPPSVMLRARLQHLSTAGAVRAVKGRPVAHALARVSRGGGKTPRITGGSSSVREAVRTHAGLASWLSYDDTLFLANASPGGVSAAWAAAEGHTLGEVLCATVVANEIAGRVGASLLLGPAQGPANAVVHAVASAAALGWLQGLDADELAHALALSMSVPATGTWHAALGGGMGRAMLAANPAVAGVDAVAQAQAGVKGSLDLLDARDGLLGALSWAPLRAAFTGLGSAWLTETLAFSLIPANLWHQVPIQSVGEILRRHVKASDKRLRVDQIERIEVSTTAFGWALEQKMADHPGLDPASVPLSLRRSVGALVVAYELGPDQLEPAWLEKNRDDISEVARRVDVSHDWRHTLKLVDHMVDVLSPLLAGVTSAELVQASHLAKASFGLSLPRPGAAELLGVLQSRPDRLLERLKHSSGDLSHARLREFQFQYGSDVKLYTTRGGSWPEQRSLAEGSPGWPWDQTVEAVLAKYAGADDPKGGAALMSAETTGAGGEWVHRLFGA